MGNGERDALGDAPPVRILVTNAKKLNFSYTLSVT